MEIVWSYFSQEAKDLKTCTDLCNFHSHCCYQHHAAVLLSTHIKWEIRKSICPYCHWKNWDSADQGAKVEELLGALRHNQASAGTGTHRHHSQCPWALKTITQREKPQAEGGRWEGKTGKKTSPVCNATCRQSCLVFPAEESILLMHTAWHWALSEPPCVPGQLHRAGGSMQCSNINELPLAWAWLSLNSRAHLLRYREFF